MRLFLCRMSIPKQSDSLSHDSFEDGSKNMGELVECHSGFTYADKPIALTWESRRLEIVEISARWQSPEARHFRVCTNDGQKFELSYHEADNEWQITQL
jgi:hypothetical protein